MVRYRRHGKTIVQSTPVTSTMAKILRRLGIPLPQRMLDVSDEATPPPGPRYMRPRALVYPID